jgi:chlorobactene glucosyltransferase
MVFSGLTSFYWWVHLACALARMIRARFVVRPDQYPLPSPGDEPRVSVLIPARDEAAVIGRCLDGVLAQDHPIHEVLVLDDGSEDDTATIVDRHATRDPRVRRLPGAPLPEGWKGKNWALHQAAQQATGDWLLFIDADVQLAPQALRQAAGLAEDTGADMVSWFAQLEMGTFWERAMMPFIADFIVLFSPLDKVNDPDDDHCIANGQFIHVRRGTYDQVGGHEGIRDSIIDDVSLARAVKFGGGKLRMAFALGLMRTRMYTDLSEIWSGWAKNFYPAMQARPGLALAAVAYLTLTGVWPFVLAPVAVASMFLGNFGPAEVLTLTAAAGIVAYRTITRWVDAEAYSWGYVLLHPLQATLLSGIIIDSMAQTRGWRRTTWKGRTYEAPEEPRP